MDEHEKRIRTGLWDAMVQKIVVHAKLRVRPFTAGEDGRSVKALDEDGRLRITSLASTPDIDEMDEIVEAAAFASSIDKFGEIPMMLAYHDMAQPVGRWDVQKITKSGLVLEGFVSSGRPDIQQLVLDGVLAHSSIGFFVKDVEWDEKLEVLRIKDLELVEVSLVPIPANRSTFVTLKDAFQEWRTGEVVRRKALPETPAEEAPAGPPEPEAVRPDMTPILSGIAASVSRIGRSLAQAVEMATGE